MGKERQIGGEVRVLASCAAFEMKRLIQILTLPIILVGFSLSATVMAWGMTTKEFLMPIVWIATIVAFILTFIKEKIGLTVLIVTCFGWLFLFAEYFGHFLTFEADKIVNWGLRLSAAFVICPLTLVFLSTKRLVKNKKLGFSVIATSLLIPLVGFGSNYDKTYSRTTFAEFHRVNDSTDSYLGRFRAGPADTRFFEIEMNSDEVKEIALTTGTYLVGHYYINNVKLNVRMNFSSIKEIELTKLNKVELENPIKWELSDVEGQTEYLKN
ncbi:hypothetical protein [Phaeodactylibacter luteus]|uniref:hypothetical protein n=1 Tax=Phaeodactylibacter luteus TaxID=1564516 RepID=UPI0011BDF8BF|nr:hypothetical protein [Phaeodactylibacter luteus]